MKVGVKFGDNDFYCTLQAFMQSAVDAYNRTDHERDKRRGDDTFINRMLTKERIVKLFNALAPGLYLLHQNQFTYEGLPNPEKYLRIETKHVFLGDEVDQYVKERGEWDNGEFQWVDLGVDNTINCI
jgi:hypothetical protein